MPKLPLPDDQPVAVNALRNKRSALMGELTPHQQECGRIRSEIIHLDVVLRLFDPATDPGEIPTLRKRVHRTEWFARGEQTNMVYDTLCERGTVSATELADAAVKRKGIATHDRPTRREFVSTICCSTWGGAGNSIRSAADKTLGGNSRQLSRI